jgi:hypothetical protein
VEHITDSLKVRVWCGLLHDCLIEPVFFAEATVTSSNYLAMMENIVYQLSQELQHAMFFQIDGARPHWNVTVHESLNQHFQN